MNKLRICLLVPIALMWSVTHAALPAAVDGQPLPSLAPLLEQVTPAVVNVQSRARVAGHPLATDPFFQRFFGLPRERVSQSLGSGVIVDADRGLVLTNSHVVRGADEIDVTLTTGQTLAAAIVGVDPDTDLAVLELETDHGLILSELPLADSTRLRVGDFVIAVGNPFGLGQTVTSGIVSALGRKGLRGLNYQNFIQTDASINPGNSGGALVNLHGELIGINTAIFSPSGGNVGIGFAIPAAIAAHVSDELLNYGLVRRGRLGLALQDLDLRLAAALGLDEDEAGAVVTRVLADSGAGRAGLQAGDLIIAIGETQIRSSADLRNAEGLIAVGRPVSIRYVREGAERTVRVTVDAADRERGGDLHPGLSGAILTQKTARDGLVQVVVEQVLPGSLADDRGLRAGDWLREVNGESIGDLVGLQDQLARADRLLLTIQRGRRLYRVMVD